VACAPGITQARDRHPRSGKSALDESDKKSGRTVKRIAWAALAATAFLALYAGKDDIRRFYRMYSMCIPAHYML
jgi:hypothetical protein